MHPSRLVPTSSCLRRVLVATLSLAGIASHAMGAGVNSLAAAATTGQVAAYCVPATGLVPRGRLASDSGCGAGATYRTEQHAWNGAPRGRMGPTLTTAPRSAADATARVAATVATSLAARHSQ